MREYIGLDTSNYTTSCAILDAEHGTVRQAKKLLPVKAGMAGLRQSDAFFHHTRQLPEVLQTLLPEAPKALAGIGVSVRPRNIEGSYMPCFLCGKAAASAMSVTNGVPVYETSHQVGHILAALYSAGQLSLLQTRFLAFHVSGGTTDCLLCEPDDALCLRITQVGTSLDLKAGQAIDRVGLMLQLQFPCGAQLEQLAADSEKQYRTKPVIRDGNCCLSGLENLCQKMIQAGEAPADVARYCLTSVRDTIAAMTQAARQQYGDLPVLYAGGVMSNQWMRKTLQQAEQVFFAEPAFSCDNAVGTAVYAAIQAEGGISWQCSP
jgi:N6-L-threonylcarbamoyladenine synthase